jgi:hypothetical protein
MRTPFIPGRQVVMKTIRNPTILRDRGNDYISSPRPLFPLLISLHLFCVIQFDCWIVFWLFLCAPCCDDTRYVQGAKSYFVVVVCVLYIISSSAAIAGYPGCTKGLHGKRACFFLSCWVRVTHHDRCFCMKERWGCT